MSSGTVDGNSVFVVALAIIFPKSRHESKAARRELESNTRFSPFPWDRYCLDFRFVRRSSSSRVTLQLQNRNRRAEESKSVPEWVSPEAGSVVSSARCAKLAHQNPTTAATIAGTDFP
jgi:hypothetical protein